MNCVTLQSLNINKKRKLLPSLVLATRSMSREKVRRKVCMAYKIGGGKREHFPSYVNFPLSFLCVFSQLEWWLLFLTLPLPLSLSQFHSATSLTVCLSSSLDLRLLTFLPPPTPAASSCCFLLRLFIFVCCL